jgi:hypothetical protein
MNGILGIDPGLKGGLAIRSDAGLIAEVMPEVGGELDIAALSRWLFGNKDKIDFAFVEKVHAFEKASRSSMLKFGRLAGAVEGSLAALNIPYELVRPNIWTKEIHTGVSGEIPPKKRSAIVASRIYPNFDFKASSACKKPHDGLIDAALIAEYGYRKLKGTL